MSISGVGNSGIEFVRISVDKLNYELEITDAKQPILPDTYVKFNVDWQIVESTGAIRLTVSCERPKDVLNGHKLEARFIAIYRKISETTTVPFDEFLVKNGPIALFAFVREIVHSITSRSGAAPILLDPVNLYRMMDEGILEFEQVHTIRHRKPNDNEEESS
jgi:preprotein translocase subunit SecB